MKVYELNVYCGDLRENSLYPTYKSAMYHARLVSEIEGTTEVWLRVWVRDNENGIYKVESNDPVYAKSYTK